MEKGFTVLDGAMGTFLAAKLGPSAGEQEAALNTPDVLTDIHKSYVDSGTDIVYAATFSSNAYKAKLPINESIPAALKAARASGAEKTLLDVGPTGKLVGKYGDISREDAYSAFSSQIAAGPGADAIIIETMFDLGEMRTAILAAREHSSLPIYATMSFAAGGRSLTGCTPRCFALTAESLGVSALGLNCSLGPKEMLPLLKEAAEVCNVPLIFKPNAGMPDIDGNYGVTPGEFAELSREAVFAGATLLGGCCGTSPEYIKGLKDVLSRMEPADRAKNDTSRLICSISEVLNADDCGKTDLFSLPEVSEAAKDGDWARAAEAATAIEEGAVVFPLDLLPSPLAVSDAVEEICFLVKLPFLFKSESKELLEAALRAYSGKAGCMTAAAKDVALKYGAVVV